MNILDGNRFKLQVKRDETVTVRITQSTGIQNLINYSWNSIENISLPKNTPYTRKIKASDPNPSDLAVTVHFADSSGGNFRIEVTGDKCKDISQYDYEQADGEAFKTLGYTFFIVAASGQ